MEFSEFASRLHAIIGAGSSTTDFTKAIIEAILADDAPEITDEYGNDTYKAYFNGNTRISRMARKVMPYLEWFNFSAYIDKFSDAAHDSLVESFSDVLPDANAHNIGEQLAKLFESIINEAAGSKRNSPKKTKLEETLSGDQQVIVDNIKEPLLMFAKAIDTLMHEVEDDKQPSDTAYEDEDPVQAEVISDPGVKVQIINNPTIVNQNGEKNIHIEHLDVLNL